jgi:SAM-dependent methyltransferase
LQPFDAVNEIRRILKPGGVVIVSTPFNFRIHGPLPDCWRFTEHGLRALFKDYEIISLDALEEEDRFLMPIHYTLIARKYIRDRFAPNSRDV